MGGKRRKKRGGGSPPAAPPAPPPSSLPPSTPPPYVPGEYAFDAAEAQGLRDRAEEAEDFQSAAQIEGLLARHHEFIAKLPFFRALARRTEAEAELARQRAEHAAVLAQTEAEIAQIRREEARLRVALLGAQSPHAARMSEAALVRAEAEAKLATATAAEAARQLGQVTPPTQYPDEFSPENEASPAGLAPAGAQH